MRILAIDPGEKRTGIAVSDPTGTIASPLTMIKNTSRLVDSATIAELARENQVGMIVMGKSMDENGLPTPQSRRADRLVEAIQQQCDIPIITWDESFSTQIARQAQVEMGTKRQKRSGHLDALAAMVILQSYLNSKVKGSYGST
jgi:putative pre-16S rRNA nuclease